MPSNGESLAPPDHDLAHLADSQGVTPTAPGTRQTVRQFWPISPGATPQTENRAW